MIVFFYYPKITIQTFHVFFHSDTNTQQLLNDTITGIKLLLERLVQTSKNEVLSITLAWNIEDKKVVISMLGHVTDLSSWIKSFEKIPVDRKQFKAWLSLQAEFIKANGKVSQCPVLAEVICGDGTLYMRRRLVQKDAALSFPDKSDIMKFQLSFDGGKEDLAKSVNDEQLFIAPSMILKKMLCEKSGQDYADSPYSVILDDDTSQKMVDCTLVSFHWTDKPRPIAIE